MRPSRTLDLQQMMLDPLPTFSALRASGRWTWFEEMQMWLVTRFDDVVYVDTHPEIFSSEVPGALATRAMGVTMIRSEGSRHRRFRSAGDAPLKRRSLERSWSEIISGLAEGCLRPLRERGAADLVADFSSPYTDAVLRDVLGLLDAEPGDIERWSDAYIQAAINNSDSPEVWQRAAVAAQECEDAVAAAMKRARTEPDASVVSAMTHAHPDAPLSLEEIAANIRLMISGGFNDARDAVATLSYLLMTHPETRRRVAADAAAFERSIDESVRWLSPVGSFPRVVVEDFSSPAAQLRAGEKVLVVVAAANHDERKFADPEAFDIERPGLQDHLGFSTGAHYCLGSHLVRAMMRAAVPAVLAMPGIHLTRTPTIVGWQFRGPDAVHVEFEPHSVGGPRA